MTGGEDRRHRGETAGGAKAARRCGRRNVAARQPRISADLLLAASRPDKLECVIKNCRKTAMTFIHIPGVHLLLATPGFFPCAILAHSATNALASLALFCVVLVTRLTYSRPWLSGSKPQLAPSRFTLR